MPVISSDMDIPTICFGFTLGFMVLTGSKVGKQTISIWKRTKSFWHLYLFMIWAELVVNLVFTVVAWFFLRGNIKRGPGIFVLIAVLWTIQTQCLLQIIANRIGLVFTSRRNARLIKIGVLVICGLINVSVYIVWIPAQIGVSDTFTHLNQIWDRIEKSLFLMVDFGLNGYFLWIVRSKLIVRGFTKYTPLFRFNAGISFISISMDALIIGMMSLPNNLVFAQFHSLAYIIKLRIELSMADLISKVARRQDRTDKLDSSSGPSSSHLSDDMELTPKTRTSNFDSTIHGSVFQITSRRQRGVLDGNHQAQPWTKKRGNMNDAASDTSSDSVMDFRIVPPENSTANTVAAETLVSQRTLQDGVERQRACGSTLPLNEQPQRS